MTIVDCEGATITINTPGAFTAVQYTLGDPDQSYQWDLSTIATHDAVFCGNFGVTFFQDGGSLDSTIFDDIRGAPGNTNDF